jgi:hypothetical protein
MKALIAFLITVLAAVVLSAVLLDAITPRAHAEEAVPAGVTAGVLPGTAAAIFPPSRQTVDQISGSQFAAGESRDRSVNHDARWRRQWVISLAPLFASEALDAASSYGLRELNPLLASSNGGFGTKATGIKFGVIGALAGTEYFVVRKHPVSAKFFTIVNWVTAGATTGLAIHNFQLR